METNALKQRSPFNHLHFLFTRGFIYKAFSLFNFSFAVQTAPKDIRETFMQPFLSDFKLQIDFAPLLCHEITSDLPCSNINYSTCNPKT